MEQQNLSQQESKSLMEALAEVPDPRSKHGRRYTIQAILALAVCAMLCGARSLTAIAQWGRDHQEQVVSDLGFKKGKTPCVATLHLLFKRLDTEAFEQVLGRWFEEHGLSLGDGMAIDGKKLRGIHGEELPGVYLVAAYAHKSGVVVGQQRVQAGENELSNLPQLLEQLPLRGQVVTGDAMFTQRAICEQIVQKGGTTSLV
jgi:hypothetical protein